MIEGLLNPWPSKPKTTDCHSAIFCFWTLRGTKAAAPTHTRFNDTWPLKAFLNPRIMCQHLKHQHRFGQKWGNVITPFTSTTSASGSDRVRLQATLTGFAKRQFWHPAINFCPQGDLTKTWALQILLRQPMATSEIEVGASLSQSQAHSGKLKHPQRGFITL